jgi:hypothetical protein
VFSSSSATEWKERVPRAAANASALSASVSATPTISACPLAAYPSACRGPIAPAPIIATGSGDVVLSWLL